MPQTQDAIDLYTVLHQPAPRAYRERRGHATLNASHLDSEIFIVTKNSTFCYQLFLWYTDI